MSSSEPTRIRIGPWMFNFRDETKTTFKPLSPPEMVRATGPELELARQLYMARRPERAASRMAFKTHELIGVAREAADQLTVEGLYRDALLSRVYEAEQALVAWSEAGGKDLETAEPVKRALPVTLKGIEWRRPGEDDFRKMLRPVEAMTLYSMDVMRVTLTDLHGPSRDRTVECLREMERHGVIQLEDHGDILVAKILYGVKLERDFSNWELAAARGELSLQEKLEAFGLCNHDIPAESCPDCCGRCGHPYAPEGHCSRRAEGCQGGRGEA